MNFGSVNASVLAKNFDAPTFCDPDGCFRFPCQSIHRIRRVEVYYVNGTDDHNRGIKMYYEAERCNITLNLRVTRKLETFIGFGLQFKKDWFNAKCFKKEKLFDRKNCKTEPLNFLK